MSKGGGGSASTAGLEEATKAATALQKQIYEEGREDIQPWYQMGTGAVSKLSDLLGITGGSVQSRDNIYNSLKDQYTTQQTQNVGGSALYRDRNGNVIDVTGVNQLLNPTGRTAQITEFDPAQLRSIGVEQIAGMPTTNTVTDYDALNSAVDARIAQQGQTPEGFGSLLEKFDESKMKDSAGYKFRQEQGQKALERAMAAQGVTLGGGGFGDINPEAALALTDYSQGLASQEYGNEYNRYVNDQLNTFNMLMGASGSGQQATNQMAAGGQAYATNVGNLQTGLAGAQYQAAQANASKPSMFSQLLGTAAQVAPYFISSDRSIKENIEYTHMDNGHKMYNFNYIGGDKKYNGVMAQDVLKINPDAVVDIDGVLHVNYDAIGVEMREV